MLFNVGNKWDPSFLDAVIGLNKKYTGNKVTSLYGDPFGIKFRGVRPANRLPKIGLDKIQDYIDKASDNGIAINYTVNKSCIGAYEEIDQLVDDMLRRHAEGSNIMFTVASPFLLDRLKDCDIRIELSTIPNQTSVNFIAGILDTFKNVRKVCLPIYMNRDLDKIETLVANYPDIVFEVIVNEFCVSAKNTCIFRADCYNTQSHDIYSGELFSKCSRYREGNPAAWLMSPFILPQWLGVYGDAGIDSGKLTGRTIPQEMLLKNVERYLSRECDCDLTDLWGSGLPGQNLPKSGINTAELAESNFFKNFKNGVFSCEDRLCGEECRYCHNHAKGLINA